MAIKPTANYTVAKQSFLNSVINKIGRQEYSNQAFQNPLVRLKGDFIENASDIEEIYVSPVDDTGYDETGAGVLDRVLPSVSTQYHTETIDHGFKVSIQDKMMKKGFLSAKELGKMSEHLLQAMHTGSNLKEYNDMIDTIKALVGAKKVTNTIEVSPVIDSATSEILTKHIKKAIPKMGEPSTDYSEKLNFSPIGRLMLFIDSDVDVEMNVTYLATLFNMTVAELNSTTKVKIPNFKKKVGSNVIALLCDERCLKIHPTYYNVESIRNTRGKFTNYDLVWSILLSYTNWFPFLVFTEKTGV